MKSEKKTVVTAPVKAESQTNQEEPKTLEEIVIEELSIDGVCGVY